MSRPVLARALEPWPVPLRTLDALHLATLVFLRDGGEPIELASYDHRLLAAARALGIPIGGAVSGELRPPALIRSRRVPMFGPPQLES